MYCILLARDIFQERNWQEFGTEGQGCMMAAGSLSDMLLLYNIFQRTSKIDLG